MIADIYLGRITRRNDPRPTKLNVELTLPDTDITVVHRSNRSGTSDIFTDCLRTVSPLRDLKVGRFTAPSWPVGVGVRGNDGIMQATQQAAGSIGCVELAYALSRSVPMC